MSTATLNLKVDRVDQATCPKCMRLIEVAGRPPLSDTTCPHCHTAFNVPGQLGQYRLLRVLSRGPRAWVFEAEDVTLGRNVGLQLLLHDPDAKDVLRDFVAQARRLAQLDHPNIVKLLTMGQKKGQAFLVMHLVHGYPLKQWINSADPIDEETAVALAADITRGLQAAWEVGVVHGDLNADNVLINDKGEAQLVDIGLGLLAAKEAAAGKVWASPLYIAPEKIRSGKSCVASDLYSLGALLYHTLAQRPPFQGPDVKQTLLARLKIAPIDLQQLRPDLSPTLIGIVNRLMALDPEDRYPDYELLLADLEDDLETTALVSSASAAAPPVRNRQLRGTSARRRAPRRSSGNEGVLITVAVFVFIGLVALLVVAFYAPPTGETTLTRQELIDERRRSGLPTPEPRPVSPAPAPTPAPAPAPAPPPPGGAAPAPAPAPSTPQAPPGDTTPSRIPVP